MFIIQFVTVLRQCDATLPVGARVPHLRKNLIPLSPSETEILRIVWELDHPTVQAVCDALPEHRDIAYATVQTMLRRLEKKGYLAH